MLSSHLLLLRILHLGAYGGHVQSRSCDGQVSLSLAGPVTHGKVYSGVADGIYSINGTYGGTTGLEHMHQIVGAPSTIDTWVNMLHGHHRSHHLCLDRASAGGSGLRLISSSAPGDNPQTQSKDECA
jgi:hypothetical protein